MKLIRTLATATPGLAAYRTSEGDEADWQGFRSHRVGDSYRELLIALTELQHGLCGYCEIDLTDLDYQIEHVIPRSDPDHGGINALESKNMIACCRGGELRHIFGLDARDDAERYLPPLADNRSCGQAKGETPFVDAIDPRRLPSLPSVVRVRFHDGRLEADQGACAAHDVNSNHVENSIELLGLNVRRLRLARLKRWQNLSDVLVEDTDDAMVLELMARIELLPRNDGALSKFFTTTRTYFGPLSERILAEGHQTWI